MRVALVLIILIVPVGFVMCSRSNTTAFLYHPEMRAPSSSVITTSRPDFDKDIKPILQSRCQPCHFQGGKVYDKLPFDRAETIKRLGTKLFTRIKDEKEQKLISDFLK